MKFSSLLLTGSLVANAALAAVFFLREPDAPAPTPTAAGHATTAAAARGDAKPPSQAAASAGKAWDRLRPSDLRGLVGRLRAAGFPPKLVSVIVREVVDQEFAPRRRALTAAREKPFWKGRTDGGYDPAAQREEMVLNREEEKLVRSLLGPDDPITAEQTKVAMLRQFGREISPEKFARVQDLQADFSDRLMSISAKNQGGPYLPQDTARIQEMVAALHQDMAKVLSPEELFENELRTVSVSYQIRRDFAVVGTTEAEYRTLFPLYQALETQHAINPGSNSEADLASRRAAQEQLEVQIKAIIGPERYTAYQLGKNYDFQQTLKVTNRLGLSTDTAVQLYTLQQDMDRRSKTITGDGALPPPERANQLAALAAEAKARISATLGAPGLAAYQQYSGQWLTRLEPAAKPAGRGR